MKCFPGWVRFNFGGVLFRKIFRETNIQNGFHKLDEKLLSSVVYEHIRTYHSHFMFGRFVRQLKIQKQQKSLYNVFFVNTRGKENKEKTKSIIQK